MDKIQLIRSKIERRIEELEEQIEDVFDSKAVLRIDELKRLCIFIDSLPQEKRDFNKLYEDIAESEWFKESYHGKSLSCDEPQESSEDDTMRKELKQRIHSLENGLQAMKELIDSDAWLEKQKAPVNTSASTMAPSCWEEQKSSSTEDMPYITDEHFWEREHADSFKYKLAEYMTKNCRKEEGPYGYTYGISAESILKMAEEELLKRGVVQKPAEWGEKDEEHLNRIDRALVILETDHPRINTSGDRDWLKSLHPVKQEWSEEDEEMISSIEQWLHEEKPEYVEKELAWLESLRPPQYCENCKLKRILKNFRFTKEQVEQLKKLM